MLDAVLHDLHGIAQAFDPIVVVVSVGGVVVGHESSVGVCTGTART